MINLLMTIDRRVRYLDRAFPKSRDQLLNEEIERELARYPDGGKVVMSEIIKEIANEYPEVHFEIAPQD
jgi:hypothetical protein